MSNMTFEEFENMLDSYKDETFITFKLIHRKKIGDKFKYKGVDFTVIERGIVSNGINYVKAKCDIGNIYLYKQY